MIRKLNRRLGSAVGWIALSVLIIFILCAIFAPLIAPYQENQQNIVKRLTPPSWTEKGDARFFLGTDEVGRDLLSRLIYGSRASILVGVLAALLAGSIGVALGLLAGYFPKFDAVLMRLADIQLAFPSMLFALAIIAVLGGGFFKLILVLGISSWVSYARIVRSQVLTIRTSDYVLAAQTAGVKTFRLLFLHILPNTIGPVITIATFQIASAILAESSLSFLGVGIPPTTATWGNMLHSGQLYMDTAWWISVFPGLCILMIVVSINILGDVLNISMNPNSRQSTG